MFTGLEILAFLVQSLTGIAEHGGRYVYIHVFFVLIKDMNADPGV